MATTNISGNHHLHHHHNPTNDKDSGNFDSWNTNNFDEDHDPISKTTVRKLPRKPHQRQQRTVPVAGKSLPVNIPDWSKILRDSDHRLRSDSDHVDDDNDDGGGGGEWLPPHVYLARIRSASLSVHEGVGRTLKGRDLSRLRNAIWKQTGFELD